MVDHCDSKARSRPFTSGKLERKQVHPAIETHSPQDISSCVNAGRSRKPSGKRGIFQNGEMREQIILLAQYAHVETAQTPTLGFRLSRNWLVEDTDTAPVRFIETGQAMQQR